MGVNLSPRETISVIETINICRELNKSTEAIRLSTGEIDIFLDSHDNPIPKFVPKGSNRYPESSTLSILLNNNPCIKPYVKVCFGIFFVGY